MTSEPHSARAATEAERQKRPGKGRGWRGSPPPTHVSRSPSNRDAEAGPLSSRVTMLSGAARRAGCLSRPADEELAAKIIQTAWWSHIDRRLFRLLTHTIRAAAAVDACKLMGHRKYYDQMIWDELQYQNHKIIDEIDVATVKDYMQYISNLDETPAYFGGRDNCWRKLSLENFPRTMIMYDIMDYAQSGTLSNPLKEKLTFLLLRPQNEELRHDQLMTVSRVRSPTSCPPTATSSSRSYQPSSLPRPSVRRSRQARQKVAKMKRVHALEKEREEQKLDVINRSHLTEHQETMTAPTEDLEDHSVFSDEEWEHEAAKLYAWSQALSLEDTGESLLTPNF
ncbi:putative uncharacterized protein CXorf58 homolog isoform X2 [Gopherus evgoodei]|uniref:putative uncharacterized protein CXorf58 homolog isoform X2 n=1 Tax=Gopherus evgoodei TaxID=1825980 RepID=UPI0011CFD099|nr:putative uncharacterized protein CXorf58 homolog isoform X2 [Gopherus evgoodei]